MISSDDVDTVKTKGVFVNFDERPLPKVLVDGEHITNPTDIDKILTQKCPDLWAKYNRGEKVDGNKR